MFKFMKRMFAERAFVKKFRQALCDCQRKTGVAKLACVVLRSRFGISEARAKQLAQRVWDEKV